ncbi:PREDICTED: uncharacterized protein LOC104589968 [Nelumbo nucifera]|uniref:Uncharacterized protein LOC104589968 n=2 Tax=Nelumbo nucifera TaxID=4432 RepID=A0A1U7ZFE0_NELNU|nr:PREDICTED: uncharacterized protein LOC104589968 [Nelumbo nucifera]DAD42436.1 TPA_asm: hypothetical protein HUJ06_000666 [Nelumbo nucifera]
MATHHLCTSPALAHKYRPTNRFAFSFKPHRLGPVGHSLSTVVRSYKVTIEHDARAKTTIDVDLDETILAKALDSSLTVPHNCKLGACMTCLTRLVSGEVDQSEGMFNDDVVERGYTLLCASYRRSDYHIRTIQEEELLSLQLATAND